MQPKCPTCSAPAHVYGYSAKHGEVVYICANGHQTPASVIKNAVAPSVQP